MVQIAYTPLEASADVIREVCGCTPIRVRLTVRIVTTRYLQRFMTALQGLKVLGHSHVFEVWILISSGSDIIIQIRTRGFGVF